MDLVYEISAVTHVHGLGYSFVEIHEKTIAMNARLWVLPTPVDGTLLDLVLVSQMRKIRKPRRFITGLGFVPGKLRQKLMNHIMLSQQKRDVLQDVVIWERKRYRTPPPAVFGRRPHRGSTAAIAGSSILNCCHRGKMEHEVFGELLPWTTPSTVLQAGTSRFCSAMWNFRFLLGFIDGSGLNRSL